MYRKHEFFAGGEVEIIDDAYHHDHGFTYRTRLFQGVRLVTETFTTVSTEDAPTVEALHETGYAYQV